MEKKEMLDLQLFADGAGDGGNGSAAGSASETGVSAADAGQAELEALGVPRHKQTQRAKEAVGRKVLEQRTAQQKSQVAAGNAEEPGEADEESAEKQPRLTWKEIMQDPEYNREMQSVVKSRLESSRSAKDLAALTPALQMLADRYHLETDGEHLDAEALSRAIMEDDRYFEDQAAEMGVEPETARRLAQMDIYEKQRKADAARSFQEQQMRQHFAKLMQDAEALKEELPGFDFDREMQNPQFVRMTRPDGGLTLKQAYYAIHGAEIAAAQKNAAQKAAAEAIAASVQAGRRRPNENGGTQAPSTAIKDPRHMTAEEREEIKRRAMRGEKVYLD